MVLLIVFVGLLVLLIVLLGFVDCFCWFVGFVDCCLLVLLIVLLGFVDCCLLVLLIVLVGLVVCVFVGLVGDLRLVALVGLPVWFVLFCIAYWFAFLLCFVFLVFVHVSSLSNKNNKLKAIRISCLCVSSLDISNEIIVKRTTATHGNSKFS